MSELIECFYSVLVY